MPGTAAENRTDDPSENNAEVSGIATITDLSDADRVAKYCLENKIDKQAIDELLARGFTSLEALALIDIEDLNSVKITRGQRRLIMHIAGALQDVTTAPPSQQITDTATDNARTGSTNSPGLEQGLYNQTLLNTLISQQTQLTSARGNNTPTVQPAGTAAATSASWNDPQIHIASATGKSAASYYDICDFVPQNVEEELIIGGNGDQTIVVKSGSKKPSLENFRCLSGRWQTWLFYISWLGRVSLRVLR